MNHPTCLSDKLPSSGRHQYTGEGLNPYGLEMSVLDVCIHVSIHIVNNGI